MNSNETDYERSRRLEKEQQAVASVRARIKANPDFLNELFKGLTRQDLVRYLQAQSKALAENLVVVQAAQAALKSLMDAEKKEKANDPL
jgi:hypothetical protein